MPHGSVLPRIFASIEEEDVVACDVETAIVLVGLLGPRLNLTAKDSLAELGPVWQIKGVGSHRLLIVRWEEEAELIAVLPSPLAPA